MFKHLQIVIQNVLKISLTLHYDQMSQISESPFTWSEDLLQWNLLWAANSLLRHITDYIMSSC